MAIQSIRAEQIQSEAVTFAKIASATLGTVTENSSSKLVTSANIKSYVDTQTAAAIFGVKPKQAVKAATLAVLSGTMIADNGTVATGERTYNTTAKTITWFATQGPTAIDGVTLANGDRILVKSETATSGPSAGEGRKYNGIYVRTSLDVWTRAEDFNSVTPIDEINGASTGVQQGTQAGIVFVQYGTVATFDSDIITFTYYNAIGALASGSNGIGVSGSTISLVLDGSTLSQAGAGVKVADGGITSTQLAASAVDLTTSVVTGTLPVTKGGTGATTFTSNQILYGNGTGALQSSAKFRIDTSLGDDLIIGTAAYAALTLSGTTGNLVRTPSVTAANSVSLSVATGTTTTSGDSGALSVYTGNSAATSGALLFSTGTADGATKVSGDISLITGGVTGGATAGQVIFGVNATTVATIKSTGINLESGSTYQINNTAILSATALGSSVVSSSLTSVGTLTGGATGAGFTIALGTSTVTGTLAIANGGTGATTAANARTNLDAQKTLAYFTDTNAGSGSATITGITGTSTIVMWSINGSVQSDTLTPGSGTVTAGIINAADTVFVLWY